MSWKNRSIKEQFYAETEQRSHSEPRSMFIDWKSNEYILLRNVEETIEFLKNANKNEIAWAVESLEVMAREFPVDKVETILTIFEKKFEDFPDVEDYCEVEYNLELTLAREILANRKK